jgi:rRNA processing protein Gar1
MVEVMDLLDWLLPQVVKKVEAWQEAEQVRTRHEVARCFSTLSLKEEEEFYTGPLLELGTVLHFTEGFHVIEKAPGAPLLESEAKVCNERGLIVGVIDEVIGTVETPCYSAIAFHRLAPGSQVFYTADHKLIGTVSTKRGTDSSNWFDEEQRNASGSDEEDEGLEEGEIEERQSDVALPAKRTFSIFAQPPSLE